MSTHHLLLTLSSHSKSNCTVHLFLYVIVSYYLLTVAASATAMISVPTTMVFIACGISCLTTLTILPRHFKMKNSPGKYNIDTSYFCFIPKTYSYYVRYHLISMLDAYIDLRNSLNMLRWQVNAFGQTVDILSKTVSYTFCFVFSSLSPSK